MSKSENKPATEQITPDKATPDQPNFEQALAALETIVQELEEGQIGLAEALARYEQGVTLLKQCYELLQRAEQRIELLSRIDSSGQAITQPFDDAVKTLEEKAQARSQRRSRPAAPRENLDEDAGGDKNEIDTQGGLF